MERRSDEKKPLTPIDQSAPQRGSDRDTRPQPSDAGSRDRNTPGSARYTRPDAAEPRGSSTPGETDSEPIARGRPTRVVSSDAIGDIHLRDEAHPSQSDAFDKITPGPGHSPAVDNLVRERMEQDSPDGRPPDLERRRNSRRFFYIVLAVVWIVVISAVGYAGGWSMAALVLALTAIYIGYASWPVWRSALERNTEEKRAEREIESEGRAADSASTTQTPAEPYNRPPRAGPLIPRDRAPRATFLRPAHPTPTSILTRLRSAFYGGVRESGPCEIPAPAPRPAPA